MALTYEKVKDFIENKSNSGCKLLSENYINAHEKITIQCSCGEEFETTWNKFRNRNKRQCNKCGFENTGKELKKNQEEVKDVFSKKGYILLDKYVNNRTPMLIQDKKGYKYFSNFGNIQRGKNPNRFSKFNPYTIDNIKLWLKEHNIKYEILSDTFVNNREKIKWRCDKGHIFYMNWNNFKNGQRCSECDGSSGEIEIQNFLINNDIEFKREYWFEDCRGDSNPLRFDFAIFNNNKLILLIEFDGVQHYKPKNFGGVTMNQAKIDLKRTKEYDKIKNTYCLKNNIPLLRIPYWDFDNIEEILEEALSNNDSAYFIA